jgi:hypothetical protein
MKLGQMMETHKRERERERVAAVVMVEMLVYHCADVTSS